MHILVAVIAILMAGAYKHFGPQLAFVDVEILIGFGGGWLAGMLYLDSHPN